MSQLKERYQKEATPKLMTDLGLKNPLAVPRIEKVVVSMGVGEAAQDRALIEPALADLAIITGQKPEICRSHRSIAGFNLRAGRPIGLKVTLRGRRMWDFLDRLILVALPRSRDFRGLSPRAFDGAGNYSLGIEEQRVFPEINPDKLDKVRSFGVTIITTARADVQGRKLLEMLGFPFRDRKASAPLNPPKAGRSG